ncbi:hypothetical protein Bbelb_123910 [Branchiostoma belcheri]|nr:hypothetical protein Bbelb_123910 [Branchiostoma belcheri]
MSVISSNYCYIYHPAEQNVMNSLAYHEHRSYCLSILQRLGEEPLLTRGKSDCGQCLLRCVASTQFAGTNNGIPDTGTTCNKRGTLRVIACSACAVPCLSRGPPPRNAGNARDFKLYRLGGVVG